MLMGLLLLAIVIQPLARRIHLPFTATLVVAGFLASEAMVYAGIDTGLRAGIFHNLIFYVFLPVLVFESAFNIDARLLLNNLLVILVLAIPLMLLSAVLSAVMIYAGIGHPAGFPWIAALLTGALLSATDPVAIMALFRKLGVPDRLAVLMEGESLFNDAAAIVIFGAVLGMAMNPSSEVSITATSLHFARVFIGGMASGLLTGLVFRWLMLHYHEDIHRGLISIIGAYVSFIIAEAGLHVSGVMAVLVTGLMVGHAMRRDSRVQPESFVPRLWEFTAYVANALVFLLMGVTVTLGMFEERWLAMLIGIASVLIARAIGIFAFLPLLSRLTPVEPVPRSWQLVMYWGGLRGAVTLALALALPVSLDYWWTIQSIAFGVVLFTLFVQAPTSPALIRHYSLNRN